MSTQTLARMPRKTEIQKHQPQVKDNLLLQIAVMFFIILRRAALNRLSLWFDQQNQKKKSQAGDLLQLGRYIPNKYA